MNEEVTERGLSTVTPEIIKPKRGVRRNSTGKAIARASLSLSNDAGRHRPRVLRDSTGSCHDFCKYGIKNVFEGKDEHPFLHKSCGIYATKDNGKNEVKALNKGGRREKSIIKVTVSPKLQHLKHDLASRRGTTKKKATSPAKTKGSTEEREIVKKKTSSPVKIIEVSEELEVIKRTTPSLVKDIEPFEEPEIIKQSTIPVKKDVFSEESETIEEGIPSPFKMNVLSDESEIIEQTNVSSFKTTELSEVETFKQSSPSAERSELFEDSPAGKIDLSEETDTAEKTPPSVKIKSSEVPIIKQNSRPLKKIGSSEEHENIRQKVPVVKKLLASSKSKVKQNEASPIKKISASSKSKVKQNEASPIKKILVSSKSKVKQKEASPIKKFNASAKPLLGKQTALSPAKRIDASSRPAIPEKPRTVKSRDLSRTPARNTRIPAVESTIPLTTSKGLTGRIKSENRTVKSAGLSNFGEKKTLKSPAVALTCKPPVNQNLNIKPINGNAKSASLETRQNQSGKVENNANEIEEKTLYVVEPTKPEAVNLETVQPKTSNCGSSPSLLSSSLSSLSLSSSPSVSYHEEEEEEEEALEESESTLSDGSDLVSEEEATENRQAVGDDKRRLRRVAMIHPEGKDQTPYKLRFRRGKVVSLQSENNGPTRLRFRQARVVVDNQNPKSEFRRRSFRRRRESVNGDPNNPDMEAPAVVLRHQDMQGKKDPQGLFNHVIEETASKLVETRKSKVKALVGAFETVILLQESKPSATV